MAHIGAGKIRAIAATSQRRRKSSRTCRPREQGFADTVADQWAAARPGAYAGGGRRETQCRHRAVMRDPEVRAKLAQNGVVPAAIRRRSSALSARRVCALGRIIREKGIKAD